MDLSLQQYCIALKQRNLYVSLMSGINSASQTKNREELNCTSPSTLAQLQMRRKAEVLQYKNNSTTSSTGTLSKKQQYVNLAKGTNKAKKSISSRICNDNTYLCAPSTSSDVPGPTIILCYDPSVNLIQPTTIPANKRKSQFPRDPLDRQYNAFPNTNTILTTVLQPIANFVMVVPESNYMNFSFTIPLAISMSVPILTVSSNPTVTFTPQFQFAIYYGDTLVYTPTTQPTINSIDASVNIINDSGTISATSYTESILIQNVVLPTLKQDVYTISLAQSNTIISNVGCTIDSGSSIVQWIANPSSNISIISTNCTITNPGTFSDFSYNITPLPSTSTC